MPLIRELRPRLDFPINGRVEVEVEGTTHRGTFVLHANDSAPDSELTVTYEGEREPVMLGGLRFQEAAERLLVEMVYRRQGRMGPAFTRRQDATR